MRLRKLLSFVGGLAALWGPGLRAQSNADDAAWAAFTTQAGPVETISLPAPSTVKVEVYLPPATAAVRAQPAPVILLIHGGGWSSGSPAALAPHARYLATRGFVCINASYRLTQPGITLSEAQSDVRAAFAWIKEQAAERGWDASALHVLGESAGGQLACALGLLPPEADRWRARSLVLVNPVLDLTALRWTRTIPGLKTSVPFDPRAPEQDPAWKHSPQFHLQAGAPPIFLLHGGADVTVPIGQAEAFAARAREVGVPIEFVMLDDTPHAFFLTHRGKPELIRRSLQQITVFLDQR